MTQITKLEGQLSAARDSIDLDSVVFVTDTVFVDSGESENHTYVQLPFQWEYSDQWLNLHTGIHENKQAWFNLTAPVKLEITLGNRKGVGVSSVTTTSPYVKIDDFTVVNIQEHKWYNQWYVPIAGGFVGGVATGFLLWGR